MSLVWVKLFLEYRGEQVDRMTETEWPIGMWPNHILGKIGMRPNLFWAPEWDQITFKHKSERDRICFGPRNETKSRFEQNRKETESRFQRNRKETESFICHNRNETELFSATEKYTRSRQAQNRKDDWTLHSRSWQEMQLLLEERFTLAIKYQCNEMRLWFATCWQKNLGSSLLHACALHL
jgi:hypothetical protein